MDTKPTHRDLTSRTLRAELGRRLATLRLARNVTQRALAEDAGIGLGTLRRIEAGQPASLDNLLRLAIALDVADGVLNAVPTQEIRPIERVDSRGRERRRARPRKTDLPKEPWSWADGTDD
ncbi:MAG: helix-turn-helix transcriptional regulator [Holophagales bacterium]|nr:helix-turn-helix transcriptional regulator [Holophagales bacterium]MYD20946.1 helix-turn-helix transcriptional regulator [Holophagales bacterium]MYI33295.1 helix-turn-helix transcriptional regulator [Holophagales bacterium]